MALVNIEYDPEDFIFKRESCKNPNDYDTAPNFIKELKFKSLITKLQDYVYQTNDINFIPGYNFDFTPLNDPDILSFEQYPIHAVYGICDNIEQIFKREPYIDNIRKSKNDYIIVVTYIEKENNGGWRWYKNGKYIGDFQRTEEYLRDEKNPNLKGVYVYKFYKVYKTKK